jgi:hypothetical protein
MSKRARNATQTTGLPADTDLRPEGADESWLKKWAPVCPDGHIQRLCEIVGFRLKGERYLQLRVVLTRADLGIDYAIVDEHEDRIYVRVIAVVGEDVADPGGWFPPSDEVDCPCNVWLEEPLDERVVIDIDTNRELPLYIPRWGTGEPSLYVPRPSGSLWPPDDAPSLPAGPSNEAGQ